MVGIWREVLVCGTAGCKEKSEGLLVILSTTIVTPELFDLLALGPSHNSGQE